MKNLPYSTDLKLKSRKLRNKNTVSEIILWNYLKKRKMNGYLFNRQKPLLNYIVDFYCHQLLFVIEIDGISHEGNEDYDNYRESRLKMLGITIFRCGDEEVKKDVDLVIELIKKSISDLERRLMFTNGNPPFLRTSQPHPPLQGGEIPDFRTSQPNLPLV